MAKAGDSYRKLVGTVAAALDPGSTVKTEQWIEGPDGERDMDVEMRGTLNGQPHFVLIECKDHARPIGIGFVDAFDSKIRDLKADRAIMFSNSGFTRNALRKAKRVKIEMASAMKAKDKRIRIEVHREVVAKRLTLTLDTITLHPFDGHPHEVEEKWNIPDLTFDNLPVIRWVSDIMRREAVKHEEAKILKYLCTFRYEPRWAYRGRPIKVGGLVVNFTCRKDWVSQPVEPNVSLGYYDHLKKSVVVPTKQWYALGLIDNKAWKETDQQWEDGEMEPNTFRLFITILRSNLPDATGIFPKVDELIAEQRIDTE
jgi:hypothetical protein